VALAPLVGLGLDGYIADRERGADRSNAAGLIAMRIMGEI
jgi:hypothetical protein